LVHSLPCHPGIVVLVVVVVVVIVFSAVPMLPLRDGKRGIHYSVSFQPTNEPLARGVVLGSRWKDLAALPLL
jgi:hypothetical protein